MYGSDHATMCVYVCMYVCMVLIMPQSQSAMYGYAGAHVYIDSCCTCFLRVCACMCTHASVCVHMCLCESIFCVCYSHSGSY